MFQRFVLVVGAAMVSVALFAMVTAVVMVVLVVMVVMVVMILDSISISIVTSFVAVILQIPIFVAATQGMKGLGPKIGTIR